MRPKFQERTRKVSTNKYGAVKKVPERRPDLENNPSPVFCILPSMKATSFFTGHPRKRLMNSDWQSFHQGRICPQSLPASKQRKAPCTPNTARRRMKCVSFVHVRRKLFYTGTVGLLSAAIIYHSVYNTLVQSDYQLYGLALPVITFLLVLLLLDKAEAWSQMYNLVGFSHKSTIICLPDDHRTFSVFCGIWPRFWRNNTEIIVKTGITAVITPAPMPCFSFLR